MAKTNTTTVQFSITGDGFSSSPLYNSQQINNAGEPPGSFTLMAGNNTIPVPSDALGVLVVPPPASAVVKTLKGVAGDVGIPLAPAQPFLFSFSAAGVVGNFVINAGGTEIVSLIWQ